MAIPEAHTTILGILPEITRETILGQKIIPATTEAPKTILTQPPIIPAPAQPGRMHI